MLELSNEQHEKNVNKLIKLTDHSPEQVEAFFGLLDKRMNDLKITSLNDLFVRYSSIPAAFNTDRKELLKEIVGVYHSGNLHCLLSILESEAKSKEMIEYFNKLIEKEHLKQNKLDKSSEEYRLSLENELRWLNNKKLYINQLKY